MHKRKKVRFGVESLMFIQTKFIFIACIHIIDKFVLTRNADKHKKSDLYIQHNERKICTNRYLKDGSLFNS